MISVGADKKIKTAYRKASGYILNYVFLYLFGGTVRKKLTTLMICLLCVAIPAFGNGISLNSPGPTGLGMGGAMIGVADDMTALYWNPAGLTQLKGAQIGLFVTDVIPMPTYKSVLPNSQQPGTTISIDATGKTNHYISPNIMGFVPILKGDLTVGIGAYVPAGLGTEWDGSELTAFSGGNEFEWMSKIAAFNFSPAAAYKFNDMLSVGVALNMYYGMFEIKRPDTEGQYTEDSDGMGFGVAGGVLFKPLDMLSVGLSFRTKSSISFEGDATMGSLPDTKFERDVDWPMWYGIGIAFKPMNKLTLAFDAQFSQWSESMEKLVTTYTDWGNEEEMHLYWEDQWQIRFGARYEACEKLNLRFGVYHDPAPAPDNTLNILFPSNTYMGITFGASYDLTKCMSVDFGFEYLLGDDREIGPQLSDTPTMDELMDFGAWYEANVYGAMPGVHHTDIMAISLGVNYFFDR